MASEDVLRYIKEELAAGRTKEEVHHTLLQHGWQEDKIQEAFQAIEYGQQPPLPSGTGGTLPSAGALLSEALRMFRERWTVYIGIEIISALAYGILAVGIFVAAGGFIWTADSLSETSLMGVVAIVIVTVLLSYYIQMWSFAALMYAVRDAGEGIGVREAYGRSRGAVLSLWWLGIIWAFIVLGGFFLFIIPGVIFFSSFSLATYILVSERLRGMDAMLKSKQYVEGLRGKVLCRLLFILLIAIILIVGVRLLVEFLQIPLVGSIVSWFLTIIFAPLGVLYGYLLYRHVRVIKGDVQVVSSRGNKAKYIAVGVLGFLLIPILLFGIVLLSLNSARDKAVDARRESDLQVIKLSLELYHDVHQRYPSSLKELGSEFILQVPKDPRTQQDYQYTPEDDNSTYSLCAQLQTRESCVRP